MSISSGVQAIVNRMASHPNEFFGDAGRWNFIFKDNFKDIMTEPEKAAMYDALKTVRRQQFETLVMTTLLVQDQEGQDEAEEEQRERAYRLGAGNRATTSGYKQV